MTLSSDTCSESAFTASDKETDFDDLEFYDEYGLPQYRKNSPQADIAQELVHLLSLRLIGLTLEHYLSRLKEIAIINPDMDEAYGFLSESVLKGLSQLVYQRNTEFKTRMKVSFNPGNFIYTYL